MAEVFASYDSGESSISAPGGVLAIEPARPGALQERPGAAMGWTGDSSGVGCAFPCWTSSEIGWLSVE